MPSMNPRVDEYLSQATQWREAMELFRQLLLDCDLTEGFKWAKPCYSFHQANVVLILPLKPHCALLFCKGALLQDPHARSAGGKYPGGAADAIHPSPGYSGAGSNY